MSITIPDFTIDHDGVTYHAEVMDATEYSIGVEDHGCFAAHVQFQAQNGGYHQGTGWLALDAWDEVSQRRMGTAQGMEWLIQCHARLGPPIGKLKAPVSCVVLREQARGFIRGFATRSHGTPLLIKDVFGGS